MTVINKLIFQKYIKLVYKIFIQGYDPSAPVKKAAKPRTPKPEKPDVSADLDMESFVKSGKVNKLTVDVLKGWLKTRGVHVSNKKKAELVDAVLAQFKENSWNLFAFSIFCFQFSYFFLNLVLLKLTIIPSLNPWSSKL